MGRIEWQRTDHSERGMVGGLALFTVGYKRQREWYIRTKLPGFRLEVTRPTPDEAKAVCESMLDRFVARVGATWPPQYAAPQSPDGSERGADRA